MTSYPENTKYIGKFQHGTGMQYFFDENMVELGYEFNHQFFNTTKGRSWAQATLDKLVITEIISGNTK
jgi:hypothetical protein